MTIPEPLTAADLAAMRARLAAADPPPWRADIDDGDAWTGKFYVGEDGDTWCTYDDGPRTLANVRLAESAPEDMRRLLAEVERLTAENEGMRMRLDVWEARA